MFYFYSNTKFLVGLRQDYASTSVTVSRRCSSFSLNSLRRSDVDLEEDDEEDEDEGYDQLPPPQPRLFRTGSVQRGALPHSHTFSSFRDCRRSSTASSFSLGGLAPYTGAAGLSGETYAAYRNSAGSLCFFFFYFKKHIILKMIMISNLLSYFILFIQIQP